MRRRPALLLLIKQPIICHTLAASNTPAHYLQRILAIIKRRGEKERRASSSIHIYTFFLENAPQLRASLERSGGSQICGTGRFF